ncbi:uncharacterized protein RCC_10552 [Ramularia collo-cygni]|uniref:Uncharacterized protein n=1 Tax=Ramularia collo-cygni TaxID=112498 RepID=A0A2D3VP58_9PEZI|nr:uncharacterized protein RCC_10552 [Ramularia collo-cygni]CZT24824.1 uncharacterized protein RCC_10552 [Ramularia collo-cygni]
MHFTTSLAGDSVSRMCTVIGVPPRIFMGTTLSSHFTSSTLVAGLNQKVDKRLILGWVLHGVMDDGSRILENKLHDVIIDTNLIDKRIERLENLQTKDEDCVPEQEQEHPPLQVQRGKHIPTLTV